MCLSADSPNCKQIIEATEEPGPAIKKLRLDDIRREVPADCFKKDAITSIGYLIHDWIIIYFLYQIVPYIEGYFGYFGLFLWYWVIGLEYNALFMIGHDCGHGSFSNYKWLNDLCGHLAHAPILTPYWPFQKSHRLHHIHTNHKEKDHGFHWFTKEQYDRIPAFFKYFTKIPITGWFRYLPMYTIFGFPDGSHFYPFSKLFTCTEERVKCAISGLLCALSAYVAFLICGQSWLVFFKYYYIPVSFQGLIFVAVTYLQHRNEKTEVYEQGEWAYVRAQTQTIDREFGFGLDYAMHHVTDGHVAHHFFFTEIPHYNLLAATEGIKKALKPYEGTYNGYKSERTYDWLFRFFYYNLKLDYLVPKYKGVLQYRVHAEEGK